MREFSNNPILSILMDLLSVERSKNEHKVALWDACAVLLNGNYFSIASRRDFLFQTLAEEREIESSKREVT